MAVWPIAEDKHYLSAAHRLRYVCMVSSTLMSRQPSPFYYTSHHPSLVLSRLVSRAPSPITPRRAWCVYARPARTDSSLASSLLLLSSFSISFQSGQQRARPAGSWQLVRQDSLPGLSSCLCQKNILDRRGVHSARAAAPSQLFMRLHPRRGPRRWIMIGGA
jgi:hypothetical protein